MKDMLTEIYDLLLTIPLVKEKIGKNQIKFYEASERLDYSKPFILIDPIGVIESFVYGSDKELSQIMSYQINVESYDRKLTKQLSKEIKKCLFEHDFKQLSGGLDEYFKETNRFVDARRYRKNTKLYENDY